MTVTGMSQRRDGYVRATSEYVTTTMHRVVAEQALGHPLPPSAEVHHVNGIRSDNRNKNLVICQDRAYHMLLHVRTRAFHACGNASFRRCAGCGQWVDPAEIRTTHRHCRRAKDRASWNAKHGDPILNRRAARQRERDNWSEAQRAKVVQNALAALAVTVAQRNATPGMSSEIGKRAWATRISDEQAATQDVVLAALHRLREAGWPIHQIARKLRELTAIPISQGTVCVWLAGKRRPHLDYLDSLSAAARSLQEAK